MEYKHDLRFGCVTKKNVNIIFQKIINRIQTTYSPVLFNVYICFLYNIYVYMYRYLIEAI